MSRRMVDFEWAYQKRQAAQERAELALTRLEQNLTEENAEKALVMVLSLDECDRELRRARWRLILPKFLWRFIR